MSRKNIKKAQKTRSQIARVFEAVAHERVSATDVLRTPPSCLNRLLIYDVLRRMPSLGKDGAENVLKASRVWPLTRVGNLTPEEKSAIISHLPPRVREMYPVTSRSR